MATSIPPHNLSRGVIGNSIDVESPPALLPPLHHLLVLLLLCVSAWAFTLKVGLQ
jgi:hypothetical protein